MDIPFRFGNKEKLAFELIKQAITSAPVLQHFNPEDQIITETDASDYATGPIISQLGKDGKLQPIAFLSHQMDSAQLNYPVHSCHES